ncbi:hypothetical protein Bca4012_060052 [Brassica carinata]
MMKKVSQLSFTVLSIFLILVLGMMVNAVEKKKLCKQQQLPVNSNGVCVDSECQAKCVAKLGANGKSLCHGSKGKTPMNCHCGIPC